MNKLKTFDSFVFPYLTKFKNSSKIYEQIKYYISFYYLFMLFISVQSLLEINQYSNLTYLELLWPVKWISFFSAQQLPNLMSLFFIGSAFLCVLMPGFAIIRFLGFLGVFEYTAFIYSFGKIDHNYHILILISFILSLGPNWNNKILSKSQKARLLFTFWGCQIMILLTYTMSGLGKIWGAIEQIIYNQTSLLDPNSLGLVVADRLVKKNETADFGRFLIDNPQISWPMFIASIYLEFFSLYVAFKPSLHKFWGLSLISFHLAIFSSMRIIFFNNIFILALFFINSPFVTKKTSIKEIMFEMPIFGFFIKKMYSKVNHL